MHEGRQRSPLRRLRELGLAGVVGVLAGGAAACHRGSKDAPEEGARAALPPVPAPASLIAEGAIASPDATWQRLQRGMGGAAGLLPTTLGGAVCAAAGLDARLGGEISGASPAYLVVAGDPASPSWVLAARLVEERRARPLFEGASAVFDARDAGGGLIELSARGRPPARGGVAAIAAGGWVVIGGSTAALVELAPYATRTLPTKGAAKESIAIDVPQAALAGSLAGKIAATWSDAHRTLLENDRALREAHGGRAPDFGDPRAIVGALDSWVQTRLAALRDLRGAHVAIDVGDDDVRATVTAPPASPDGAASAALAALHSGDVAPLASAPRETVLALLARDDAASRAKDAADLAAAIDTTLGARLAPADAKRVHAAIDDWYGARGDWATLAVTLTPTDRGVVADVAAADPARASRAVREAVDLLAHVPAIHEPLGAWLHVRDVTLSSPDVPGGGRASMATFATEKPTSGVDRSARGADSPSSFALAWEPASSDLKLALATTPLPLLASPLPGTTLGDDPAIRAALAAVGGPVAGAIVAQPGRSPGCSATGGIVVAWGQRPEGGGQALWGTVVASDSSLRCVAKSFL